MADFLLRKLFDNMIDNSLEEVRIESGKPVAVKTAKDAKPVPTGSPVHHVRALSLAGIIASESETIHVLGENIHLHDYSYKGMSFPITIARNETLVEIVIARAVPDTPQDLEPSPMTVQEPAAEPEIRIFEIPPEGWEPKKLLDTLLAKVRERKASDLHLYSNLPPICRIDGELVNVRGAMVFKPEHVGGMLECVIPQRFMDDRSPIKELDFMYELPGTGRFRVNVFTDIVGPGGVFRFIPENILTIDQLGLPPIVKDFCAINKGLVLVTGATGTGKTTTLASMIDHINNTQKKHIVTIEDPVEFVYKSRLCTINQREVGFNTISFAQALRSVLREDPDIVLVGELRDLETVAMALETAETGHLVFGTLHTNTAASAIDRIIDQFPASNQEQIRVMLAATLRGVISQTLCKRIGGGRIAAFEILNVTPAISNLIREKKVFQIPSLIQTGRSFGMITMNDFLLEIVTAGKITPLEAYSNSIEREAMKKMLSAAGKPVEEPSPGAK